MTFSTMRGSIEIACLFGIFGVALAGTYPGFSFLTSETSNYPPPSYYSSKQPSVSSYETTGYSSAPPKPSGTHTVVRTLRSPPSYGPTVYVSKAPLYYPEATVFSDPLPIVQLPQLPAEFLTLNTPNFGAYGGSQNEVPKKSSKKGRRGKNTSTTPAPSQDEDDKDAGTDEEEQTPRQRQRSRSRQRDSFNVEPSGGYPSSFDESSNGGTGRSNKGTFDAEPAGGYPSSFDANANNNQGTGRSKEETSRPRNRSRSRGNRPNSQISITNDEDEAGDDEPEMMVPGEDVDEQDDNVQDNVADTEDQQDDAEEEDSAADDEEEVQTNTKTGNQSSKTRGSKRRGKGKKGKSADGSGEDDDASSLSDEISNKGQKIETFFVPTFGNNVLNTVYPSFSQNALLRSLNSQSYPNSGQDVSGVSITAEPTGRKSKSKRTKPKKSRKNRPRSRGRPGNRGNNARDQEPNAQYGTPPNQNNAAFSDPQQQYGSPAQSQGISPPSQSSNAGGYSTINNEMRGRTSDPPQFRQQQQQQYGAPSSSNGGGRFIEPRQRSQGAIIGNQSSPSGNGQISAELIRTVQAILERYPN